MRPFTIALAPLALMFTFGICAEDSEPEQKAKPPSNIIFIKLKNGETHVEETIAQIERELERRWLRGIGVNASDTQLQNH